MAKREELFKRWMALKDDIQHLAGLVQNETPAIFDEKDVLEWLKGTDAFINKFNQLKCDTLRVT